MGKWKKKKIHTATHRIILHASTLTVFSQSLMLIIKASLYVTKFVKMRSMCMLPVSEYTTQSNGVYYMKMAVYWILTFGEKPKWVYVERSWEKWTKIID